MPLRKASATKNDKTRLAPTQPFTCGFTFTQPTMPLFGAKSLITQVTNKPLDIQGQSSKFIGMETENNVSPENTSRLQNPSVEKDCCGICLAAYKSPRILPCKHIFCRLCLTKQAGKDSDQQEPDECQKVFCVSCKIIHDNLLKHEVQDLKLDLSQGKCLKHPEVKVGYLCLDCCSTLCTECVKSEHSLHQTQTIKSYLIEIERELMEYSSKIVKKVETVEMSKVLFTSITDSKVMENIEHVEKLSEDFKIDLEKACRSENKKQHKDKTLLNRINLMGKRVKESIIQRKFNQNLMSEIKELKEKITTHENFYLPNNVDDIIDNQIGTMDVQMGRLFVFQLKDNRNAKYNFFFANINWTLSSTSTQSNGLCISLTPFRKPEDNLLIESITSAVTIYVEGRKKIDDTVSRKFSKTSRSAQDQVEREFKNYGNIASCVKVLFQMTEIKHRMQVE
ncbi:hypothetical protein LOTGIDRAFT_159152 [Lottia gigantea]|uniref:B box-type domain-containing protein n=1 Tax=Lottia gigantea TaxID=225164 RepID=V4C9D8_LOTGI|nr:hypothetical protein LOTGIDRAFT_159152 [Lottia gigantea]ESO98349.1 hypothetical protein LOTGIDRAFT_159152 [Lottia gigantea]